MNCFTCQQAGRGRQGSGMGASAATRLDLGVTELARVQRAGYFAAAASIFTSSNATRPKPVIANVTLIMPVSGTVR